MTTSAAGLPYRPDSGRTGSIRAFALAAAVHCLLFTLLYFGIRWQSRPPAAIEAELWTELPPLAAPRPAPRVEPPPPRIEPKAEPEAKPEPKPVRPEIAIKEEKKKPEPKKIEEKPRPRAEDDPIKRAMEKEDKARMTSEADKELARQKAATESAAQAAAQAAAQNQRAQAEWADRVKARVRSKIPYSIASAVTGNPEVVYEVTLLPGLEVGSVRLTRSSGNPAYDEAVERAIKAASPLPPPTSGGVAAQRALTLRWRVKDE